MRVKEGSPAGRRCGMMLCSMLALSVVGLSALLAGNRHQTQGSTQQLLAHQLAAAEASTAAESATEECVSILRSVPSAEGGIEADGAGQHVVRTRLTQGLIEEAGAGGRIALEPVRVRAVGKGERRGRSVRGVLEFTARAWVQAAGLRQPRVTRAVVRRYVYWIDPAEPGKPAAAPDLEPHYLCQWVTP